jgi:hypothetical protein
MKEKLKRKAIATAAAVAALAGGGAAIAAVTFGSDADEQAIIDDAAARLGVEPSELSEALEQAYAARVDAAVADGDLTEEQGAALKERIEAGELPLVGGPLVRPHGPGFHHLFGALDTAASYLGLTVAELREQLEAGQTLAEIATAEGETVDGLERALLDAATEELAAAVADERITEAKEQEILANLPERIDDLVNGELHGPRGPGLGRGDGAAGESEPAAGSNDSRDV